MRRKEKKEMKFSDQKHCSYKELDEEGERGYISSVNMDIDYRVSPEAGDISHLIQCENDSENWFITQFNKQQRLANALNKRKC